MDQWRVNVLTDLHIKASNCRRRARVLENVPLQNLPRRIVNEDGRIDRPRIYHQWYIRYLYQTAEFYEAHINRLEV